MTTLDPPPRAQPHDCVFAAWCVPAWCVPACPFGWLAQMSPTGTPYGFQPRLVAGRAAGFPVLVELGLPGSRAAQLLTYLRLVPGAGRGGAEQKRPPGCSLRRCTEAGGVPATWRVKLARQVSNP